MKTTRRSFCATLIGAAHTGLLCSILLLAQPAHADEPSQQASAVVSDLVEEIWAIQAQALDAQTRERRIAQAIVTRTNVDLLSRLSLGRYWRSLSSDDRDAYQSIFAQSVIGNLANRLEGAVRDLEGPLNRHFVIISSRATGKKDIFVRSKVVATDGQPLSVDWRLREAKGSPVIIDLVVEGVSLLVSQRAEFAAVIERSGVSGLIENLRRNVRDVGS
ncbi:MAG: ABC transporter substrate-binding protein [Pseudomonadota bacterium]